MGEKSVLLYSVRKKEKGKRKKEEGRKPFDCVYPERSRRAQEPGRKPFDYAWESGRKSFDYGSGTEDGRWKVSINWANYGEITPRKNSR
ncbi:MAG: hypothetical protein EAZ09_05020 [Oscillatoriales cyanobacterium]|nr:MAG: hypothetical protein EAZ18_02650 [Oscillatoriales cyanobacterium]TAH24205.1 MAG: hypothetical protein EAZ09_05020 [Oscillatoriales cyanobacterium]